MVRTHLLGEAHMTIKFYIFIFEIPIYHQITYAGVTTICNYDFVTIIYFIHSIHN